MLAVECPQVVHALPGRLRLRLPEASLHRRQEIEDHLRHTPGVRRARVNSLTGNALIHFDPAVTDSSTLLAVCRPITQRPLPSSQRFSWDWQHRPRPAPADGHACLAAVRKVVSALQCLRDFKELLFGASLGTVLALGFSGALPFLQDALAGSLGSYLADLLRPLAELVAALLTGSFLGVAAAAIEAALCLLPQLLPA